MAASGAAGSSVMDRKSRVLLLAAVLVFLSACGDAERGGYCFSGSCQVADGGTYASRDDWQDCYRKY